MKQSKWKEKRERRQRRERSTGKRQKKKKCPLPKFMLTVICFILLILFFCCFDIIHRRSHDCRQYHHRHNHTRELLWIPDWRQFKTDAKVHTHTMCHQSTTHIQCYQYTTRMINHTYALPHLEKLLYIMYTKALHLYLKHGRRKEHNVILVGSIDFQKGRYLLHSSATDYVSHIFVFHFFKVSSGSLCHIRVNS